MCAATCALCDRTVWIIVPRYGREILGNGLVTAMGKRWKLQRSRMSPHFRFESLGNLLPIFTRAATRMRNKFEAVPAGASIDVGELYRCVAWCVAYGTCPVAD
mgnify:CR=1 FL=1